MKVHGKDDETVFNGICEAYSEGLPLEEAIIKAGWGILHFYKHLGEDPKRALHFENAKTFFTAHQENNLVTKALNSFEKLITGYTEIEYEEEFIPSYDEDGKEVARKVTKRKEKTKHFQPNALAVMFALEKLLPHRYSQPSKLLPDAPKAAEVQVYKIGKQIIKFT